VELSDVDEVKLMILYYFTFPFWTIETHDVEDGGADNRELLYSSPSDESVNRDSERRERRGCSKKSVCDGKCQHRDTSRHDVGERKRYVTTCDNLFGLSCFVCEK